MTQVSRRDFLKAGGIVLAGSLAAEHLSSLRVAGRNQPNIIIVLCDALSALHLSLYGYPRRTTPNIDAFAESATVFHAHYSGGNFTTTGTACMLTGMLAWKHRAINYGGLVRAKYARKNPYTLLGSEYYRFAFSQNPWPDRLMGQYQGDIDRFLPSAEYSLLRHESPLNIFGRDRAIASIAFDDFLLPAQEADLAGSSFLGYIKKSLLLNSARRSKYPRYPKGAPEIMDPGYLIPYLNETVYAGVYSELAQLHAGNAPYFSYFHLYSPHFPYRPRSDFQSLFRDDGYVPVAKPVHPLSGGLDDDYARGQRILYDGQIAQIDEEFGKLLSRLDRLGVLDDSYLILTADHGELFERGFVGHGFQFMYEPVLRIPLLIHSPGQVKRMDIFDLTSNTDILPTILSLAGKAPDAELDGRILPGLGGASDEGRAIFSMVAVDNPAFGPLEKAVFAMRKRDYKLIAYLQYEGLESDFELYDLAQDPDELNDLAAKDATTLKAMKDELFAALHEANQSFVTR